MRLYELRLKKLHFEHPDEETEPFIIKPEIGANLPVFGSEDD